MRFIKYIIKTIIKGILWFLSGIILTILFIKFIPNILMTTQDLIAQDTNKGKEDIVFKEDFKKLGEAIIRPMAESAKRRQEEREKNAPRKIIGYKTKNIKERSWEDCIEEFGRGRNEINPNVVRCQSGYTEKIPIYNK